MRVFSFFIVFLIFTACENKTDDFQPVAIDLTLEEDAIQDAIAKTQNLLIQNLMSRIDSLDLEPAVRFCAENAQSLTDSISKELGYNVKRISPKNRNSKNETSKMDLNAYRHFEKTKSDGEMATHYFDELNQTYYKPIILGMPLCLKCHGNIENRDANAYALIKELYPNDEAIDYNVGDLRGVWKVTKRH